MKRAPLLPAALLLASFAFAAEDPKDGYVASPEKDWPQWRGPRRDGIVNETGLLEKWPAEGPPLLWKAEGLGIGFSSPIIVGDSLFITGDIAPHVAVQCLDLNGKVKWKAQNGNAWTKSYPGSRASCAYSDGVVYHLNGHGRIAALDAANGNELWTVHILQQYEAPINNWGLAECLLIDGPRLIVTPGGPKATMVALDKKTGKMIWESEVLSSEKGPDRAAYASPILFRMNGRKLISGCSSHHGFGVDAETGKLLWKVSVVNTWGATCFIPTYHDGSIFYSAPDGPLGAQFNLKTTAEGINAEVAWRTHIDPLTGGGIYKDGVLYTNGCKKSKAFHCMDWKTGASKYELQLSLVSASHATSAILHAEDRLYCLFENGVAALLKPAADKFEIAGQFVLADATKIQDAWAHPVILNGRLYMRYHQNLWCFDIKKK